MVPPTQTIQRPLPTKAVTQGPRAHFFGYFDKTPWDEGGARLLSLEVDPTPRMPRPDDVARLAWIDLRSGQLHPFATSSAWNWQQGCMLRWFPGQRDTVIYNDRRDGRFVAIVHDLVTGAQRVLPRNVFSIDARGNSAACIDFARLARSRPVVGYALGDAQAQQAAAPEDDGLWLLDLHSGRERLALSLASAVALREGPDFDTAHRASEYQGLPGYEQPGAGGHRFEGASFNPSGTRLAISHRWPRRAPLQLPHFQRHAWDRLVVLDLETNQARVVGEDGFYSHHTWIDDFRILAWARQGGIDGLWIIDVSGQHAPIPFAHGVIRADTHCSISPDGHWLLGDSYPDVAGDRHLWVCDLRQGIKYDVGAYASPQPYDRGPLRCDLHPRWRPDSRAICIDSVHENAVRQLYVVEIGHVA